MVVPVAAALAALTVMVPAASAHAELRQASPRVDSVAGGTFHFVALQFTGLSETAPFDAKLYDPAGNSVGKPAVREAQQIVIPIDGLTVPGVYTVTFRTIGEDGDLVDDQYNFRYSPDAPEPEPINIDLSAPQLLGPFGYVLLMAGAAVLAFLVHRFWFAWREHQASQV